MWVTSRRAVFSPPVDLHQALGHLRLDNRVKGAGRLVAEKELGPGHHRHPDGRPLQLPARQFKGIAAENRLRVGEAEGDERFRRRREGLPFTARAVGLPALGKLHPQCPAGVEGGDGVLEDHRHLPAPHLPEPLPGKARHIFIMQQHPPAFSAPPAGSSPIASRRRVDLPLPDPPATGGHLPLRHRQGQLRHRRFRLAPVADGDVFIE